MRIAFADDKPGNRSVLRDKLRRHGGLSICFEAVDGRDFLEKMDQLAASNSALPEVVLMDLDMPRMDGVQAIATASALYPGVHFVVLTIFDDDENIFRAIQAGACGYLLKEESGPALVEQLLALQESGAGPISPSIAYKILQMVRQPLATPVAEKSDTFQLSSRELEILRLLSEGLEYKEIATRLFISPNTVKKHAIHIYEKLHVNGKAQALRIAYTRGLIG